MKLTKEERRKILQSGGTLGEAFDDIEDIFEKERLIEEMREEYFEKNFSKSKLNEVQKRLRSAVIRETLENPEYKEKTPLIIYELLRELGINKIGTYSDNDTYTIDLNDSNEYGRINSTLDRSEILDPIDESSYLTADNANLDYKYEDQFILSLIADFEEDYYQLVITEMKE